MTQHTDPWTEDIYREENIGYAHVVAKVWKHEKGWIATGKLEKRLFSIIISPHIEYYASEVDGGEAVWAILKEVEDMLPKGEISGVENALDMIDWAGFSYTYKDK